MNEPPFALVKTNPRFELGWNRLQGIVEIGVAIVVAAGLLGLFGTGPLSSGTVQVPGRSIRIDYQRILRKSVQTDITIALTRPVEGPQFSLELPATFLRDMDIVTTSPRSSAMRADADGVTYVFDLGATRMGEITLSMKPKGFGLVSSPFVANGTRVALQQFIFP